MDTLNRLAPIKKKYARGNQMPFMTKELSKEIIKTSRLRVLTGKKHRQTMELQYEQE